MTEEVGLRGYRVQDPARTLARRREIMLAMAEVIIDKGYASATLEDVAAHMGTSRAVIYYQFRSKEDLYAEIVVEAVSRAAERLEAIIERRLPPEQALFVAIEDLVNVGMEPLNRSTLVTGRPRTLTSDSRARIKAVDRAYERLLTEILRQGIASGVFTDRDPRFLRYTIMFAVNGNFIWRRPDGPLKADYILEELPRMLLNSVLAHPCDFHAHGETPPRATLRPGA
jgi:TetR/AcrR family transcriptional regulator, cholesterol catabolism regulator